MDIVQESPAKRRKTGADSSQTSQNESNSRDASGDELLPAYETVATVPIVREPPSQLEKTQLLFSPSAHVTQPTQVLDRVPDSPQRTPAKSSIVQVAASSPLRQPPLTHDSVTSGPPKRGGVLAAAMAPAGTVFRPPLGIQRPLAKAPIIISDDEGPTYKGRSSDDDSSVHRAADIKPSVFAKSDKNNAGGDRSPDKVDESPGRVGNRFKEITSNSFYKPLEKGPGKQSGAAKALASSRTATGALKRPAEAMNGSAGRTPNGPRPKKQLGPDRARLVEDIPLDSILDFNMREKIKQMMLVIPQATVIKCRDALAAKRGNVDDAMELLTSQQDVSEPVHLIISDDERPTPHARVAAKPTARRELKAPNRTIQDKWSSTQILPKPQQPSRPAPTTPQKPRRRLVQGKKAPSSPTVSSPGERAKPSSAKAKSPELWDDSDSAIASSEDENPELDGKVLNFFNTCSAKDLADITNSSEEIATLILSKRPFTTLDNVRRISADAPQKTKIGKRKTTKKPIGDKIVDTCLDMWTGYEAVDDLVTQCEALGVPVADEMKKWGFDVFGAAKNGELEVVSFGDIAPRTALRDSGIGTPTSSPAPSNGDDVVEIRQGKASRAETAKQNVFIGQPSIMAADVTLKDYQLVGLNWLALLFKKELSCILADEMGLGKTCQVIAFLAHLLEQNIRGPHLVVVPGSTLENWLREFRRFCPTLVVEPYYGPEKLREEIRDGIEANIEQINVVVTTYDLASKKVDSKFLRRLGPTVCVYDEGHALKNSLSKRYEALMKIPARFRLLLTGTPLQNNLRELAALLGFILPSLFKERRGDLDFIFKARAKTTDDDHSALLSAQRIARAKSMMTPFVLRRKKHQVLKHLPPKTSRVEYCDMTPSQWAIYNDELQRARSAVEERAAGRKPAKETGNVLMQLRKAAIHPLLFRRLFDDAKIKKMARDCLKEPDLSDRNIDLVLEDMSYYSDFQLHRFCEEHPGTMAKHDLQRDEWMDSGKVTKLAELLVRYRANGDRVLVFSQFTMVLDVLEAVMQTLQMQFFRFDGATRIDERQDMIDQFHDEPDVTVFLLSTKAGGMGINLACANRVVIFDLSFNPHEDLQAENRAHRVGQTSEVEVIRLVSRGTVEEQIFALGETKLALDDRVAGEGASEAEVKDVEMEAAELVEKMWLDSQAGPGPAESTLAEASSGGGEQPINV